MTRYKIGVSVFLGLICLWQLHFPIVYNIQGYTLNIFWYHIFPLLVALAWGPSYALAVLTLGFSGVVEWIYWAPARWQAFLIMGYYAAWLAVHGYCANRYRSTPRFYYNIFFVQLFFSLIQSLMLFWGHPADAVTDEMMRNTLLTIVSVKAIVIDFLLVAVAQVLLMLPVVRRLFRLPIFAWQRHNEKVVTGSICFSLLFSFIASGMCEVLVNHDYGFQWLYQPTERLKLVLILAMIFGVASGGMGIRFLERKLAADDKLRHSEEKWRMLFENVQDVYIEETIEGIVTMVSPSIQDRLGYCPGEVVGKESTLIYANPDERTSLLAAYRKYGTQTNREVQFRDKAGKMHWMTLNAVEKTDNSGVRKVIAVARDITELKQALAEIQKMNLRLEQRVEERTQELEAFTYTVSHDLKSPLRAIEGYSQIVREDYAKDLNPAALAIVEDIHGTALDMIAMINKLLEYATTTKININLEKIDMHDLVETAFDEIKMNCPHRIIVMEIGNALPQVFADRILLKQVVINILSNAVKFTRDRNPALIRVECFRVKGEYVFSFRDNGVGFDTEYAQKLYGIFQRLHTKEEFEGFGIGLATVRSLIEKHGGRTWIQGKSDKGAMSFFTLPVTEGA